MRSPFFLALLALSPLAAAQEPYRLPPDDIVAIADAAPEPSVSFSPDASWMLLAERDAMPSLADVSRPMLRLAGMRIDPGANAPYATSFDRSLTLWKRETMTHEHVPLPEDAKVSSTSWAHDSRHFAYTLAFDDHSELWVVSVEAPTEPRLLSERLNTVLAGYDWTPDGDGLFFVEVPEDRGPAPEAPRVPTGPNVQETSGETSPLRTYQDLLASEHDARLFEHYASGVLVRASTGGEREVLAPVPALYDSLAVSPSGRMLLTETVQRPFSYLMPYYLFPRTIEVRSEEALGLPAPAVSTRVVAHVPMGEGIPIGGVRTGPRDVGWMPGRPQTLVWVEALDGGDPDREVEHRDRWMKLELDWGQATELFRVEERARGLTWLEGGEKVIASDYDRDRRWTRSLLFDLADPAAEPVVLEDRSVRDRYGDPGRIVTVTDERGSRVAFQSGATVYRVGSGASPEGLLPFLDAQSLSSLETERLWRCEPGAYESVAELIPGATGLAGFVTRRETPTTPPNYWLRGAGEPVALTAFEDPTPQIRGITKELVKYERADGVPLSATLYLPADYEEGTRLPLFVWAYPVEYNDPSTAGQIGSSPWRFTRLDGSSHLYLLTQGYAVLDGATMPVIGDPETMNDTFVEQIVGAAQAAIDFAVERGVADRERVAVGGHSYGAFMTANLLAHCDLFAAGIARSGAYNRTLTPFGFQSERRTVWEAPDTYFVVSPFLHADRIDEPLLLIHGEADNNSGTFPMQSRRLFQAIKGNGGTARLVMLPNESHGYRGRESVLHVLAEMTDWLDRYLAPEAGRAKEASSSGQ